LARTWKDLAAAVYDALGLQPNIRFIDMPESLRAKYQYFTQADMAKLRRAGYTTDFTSLEDGVRDYVANYLVPREDRFVRQEQETLPLFEAGVVSEARG